MARVFTINFAHEGQDRSAMIAVRPTPFLTEYNISLFDEDLAHDLHSTTIVFSHDHYRYQDCLGETDLMKAILAAVMEHLRQFRQVRTP